MKRRITILIAACLVMSTFALPASASASVKCNGLTATDIGTNRREAIYADDEVQIVHALAGHDMVLAYGGDDTVCGGLGFDFVDGGDGNDTILGGPGDDSLIAGAGTLDTGDGAATDVVKGEDGNDVLVTGQSGGGVQLHGGPGNDQLFLSLSVSGLNTAMGGSGDDRIDGTNEDSFRGDVIDGGLGHDVCIHNDNDVVRNCEELIPA